MTHSNQITDLHHLYQLSEPVSKNAEALKCKANWVYLASALPHFMHHRSTMPVK